MARRRAEINDYGEENGEDSSEETTAASADANNSIIGKMRSGVTSILPNSLSKWFSPSSNNNNNNNNDSANGSYVAIKRTRSEADSNTPHAKTERRGEILRRRIQATGYTVNDGGGDAGEGDDGKGDADQGDDVEDDESNHSEDDQTNNASINVHRRKNLNFTSLDEEQPPLKRSRMTLDGSLLSSRQIVSSTPAINMQRNSGALNNHYGHLNLYAGTNRNEPGYNFYSPSTSTANFENQNTAPDIIDLIPIPMQAGQNEFPGLKKCNQNIETEAVRSRRSLNIPPTKPTPGSINYSNCALPSFKRQSLSSVKSNLKGDNKPIVLEPTTEPNEALRNTQSYNGVVQETFQNGATDFEDELGHRSVTDSEAEDADTIGDLPTNASILSTQNAGMKGQRAASSGLFNMSSGNSRSGSRTSSFGNGLNFFTHLEGRKSLFAGNNPETRTNISNRLNSSTLSLNSLSRRQFNASIYGSTSALSDSRLLNTSSPFYKGNTTYGGAAAYSKYTTNLASHSRLTPTMMRPTSSLSTFSSSCNSIAAAGDQNPSISGTAKTILDLLNDFSTPLSEAKKMAANLRQQPASHGNKSKRLCDADLHTSRSMRLQQVRSPYTRPSVMLQPKNATKDLQMPPVRELQVPSLSQLLQMKKIQQQQSLTERCRQITMEKSNHEQCSVPALSSSSKITPSSTEMPQLQTNVNTLPAEAITNDRQTAAGVVYDNDIKNDLKQSKYVNKIKNHKIAYPARSAPDMSDESPPVPANLPNIAFPMMSEMPKIDIPLPIASKKSNFSPKAENNSLKAKAKNSPVENNLKHGENFKFSPPVEIKDKPSSVNRIELSTMKFEFRKPTPLKDSLKATQNLTEMKSESRPVLPSGLFALPKSNAPTSVPTLKTGSVLDALKEPFVLPKTSQSNNIENKMLTKTPQTPISFGSQFQKASNEWDCETCMVRNKESAQKCVACDVPRKGASSVGVKPAPVSTAAPPMTPLTAGFGEKFKKQSDEWECDTCMVRNKPELDKCVSCETTRKSVSKTLPQDAAPKPFGQHIFASPINTKAPTVAIATDSGFKSLAAAQKASKWECVACMTHNEASRSKCACCEQPKPGSESPIDNAKSFNFGATAASKFNFGFGAGAQDPAKEKILCPKAAETTLNATGNLEKVADEKSTPMKGFQFGTGNSKAGSTNTGFQFGFQPKITTTQDKPANLIGNDASDGSTKASGFNLGFGISSSAKPITNVTPCATTSENETLNTSTATTANSTAPTALKESVSTLNKPINFGNTPTTKTADIIPISSKPQEGFGFGSIFQKSNTVSSSSTIASSSIVTSKVSVPIATTTTTSASSGTISSALETKNTVSPALSFGIVSTSATSTTTTSKPMFSFGATSVPSMPIGNVSSSTTKGAAGADSNNLNNNGGNVGFAFANSTQIPSSSTTTATTQPPVFGSFNFAGASSTTSKPEGQNLFGSMTSKTQEQSIPINTAPVFGSTPAQAETKTTTSNIWPKNNFLFGSTANKSPAKIGNSGSNEAASTPIFGSLKTEAAESNTASNNNQNTTPSIFGSSGVSSSVPNFVNNNTASTVLFGQGSTAVQPVNTTNLFGTNTNPTTPQFGMMSSDQTTLGNNSAANNAFGSAAPVGFGNFGAAAVTTTATSTTNSGTTQSAATPFAFGAPQTQNISGGFNFGTTSASSRPAFNFTATNQPTFNFTGSSTETTSNTPFQFNAGTAPATSNIFAPSPSSTTTTQAARRKVRIPNRRLQPR